MNPSEIDPPPIVIDINSGCWKGGYSGEPSPRAVFPAIVGRPRHIGVFVGMGAKDAYVGDEAQSKCGILQYSHPVTRRWIHNWLDVEKILHHTFYNELRVAPEEQPLLLVVPPQTTPTHKEKLTQMLFETFNVPALLVANSAAMALAECGLSTGLVLESGDAMTECIAVYETHALSHTALGMPFAGTDLTGYLMRLLTTRGYAFTTTAEREIVRDIKEKLAFVRLDKATPTAIKSYELPDGQVIEIGDERFQCAEALFAPQNAVPESFLPGIHELVYECVKRCDVDLQKQMCENIVLAGGSTMFPGISQRLEKELSALISSSPLRSTALKIVAPPERKYSTCIGGCVVASQPTFLKRCIMQEDYDEIGPRIVTFKCF